MAQMTVPHVATHGLFVDGRWIEEGDIVEIKAPFDGAVIGRVHQGTRKHAEAAIAAAVKAFGTTNDKWPSTRMTEDGATGHPSP